MWMLVMQVCLLFDPLTAECRVDVRKPVDDRIACGILMKPTRIYLVELATEIGAPIVFLSVACVKGDDT